jgi:sialate O-acetylesterase
MNFRHLLVILASCSLGVSRASADVRLADVFGSGMVLQRERTLAIWGDASPGEAVVVEIANRRAETHAAADGKWRVALEPLAAGGPFELHARGANSVVLDDVLVGDVWLCAGQSNMEWPTGESEGAREALAAADPTRLRFLRMPNSDARQPQSHFTGAWERCSADVARGISAVGYLFAVELEASVDVPIGIVQATQAGAPAEPFTPREALTADPELAPALRRFARKEKSAPGALFNAMIAPLAPFAWRGVLWYQGEANVEYAAVYRRLLPTMIDAWRRAFEQPELPFLVVQLPSFGDVKYEPAESKWAELREAQSLARRLPRVELAITLDLPASNDVHPRDKRPIARRLALLARAVVHGERIEAFGPRFRAVEIEGESVRVHFEHAERLRKAGAGPLRGFQLAGEDRAWRFADARIDGEDVVVRAAGVRRPVAVRYGWADHPEVDLENGARLPAEPFRSDDWPLSTLAPAPRR